MKEPQGRGAGFSFSIFGAEKGFPRCHGVKSLSLSFGKNRCIVISSMNRSGALRGAFVLQEFDDVDLFWDRVLEEDVYAGLEVVQELPTRQYRNVMLSLVDLQDF